MKTPDYTRLLTAFAKGDKKAAAQLTQHLTPLAYRLALRLTHDPTIAEDIAQDALLRLWRQAPDWQDKNSQVTTWLYTVTRNLCTDHHRRQVPAGEYDPDTTLGHTPDPTIKLSVDAALACLPQRQKEAIVLCHMEGLSNPEIADILETSVAGVESLLTRGRKSLKQILSD